MKIAYIGLGVMALSSSAQADQLIDHVQGIYITADGRTETFTGLLLDDYGKVKKRLQKKDKRPKKVTYYYDAQEQFLLPAFGDAHVSLEKLTVSRLGFDLVPARSAADILTALSDYARANDSKRWLVGYGWQGALGHYLLDAGTLDTAVADRPVLLFSADGQSAFANSRARELLAMSGLTLPADGRLAGDQVAAVRAAMPSVKASELDMAMVEAQDWLLSRGVVHVSDFGTSLVAWQAYRRAGDEGRLKIRISAYAATPDDMAIIAGPRPTTWLYQDRLRLTGLFLNVSAPIDLSLPPAKRFDAQLRNRMVRGASDGFALAFNADSSEALAEMLQASRDIADVYPAQTGWRYSISSTVQPNQYAMLAGKNITLNQGAAIPGAQISLGSHAPASHNNGAVILSQLLPYQTSGGAWRALSHAAAKAGEMDAFTGSLSDGQWADFILTDQNPLVSAGGPASWQINATWVAGRPAWQAPNAILAP